MRFINLGGRATLVDRDGGGIDVERASGGRLPAAPAEALDRWPELLAWASAHEGTGDVGIVDAMIGAPSPAARQIFGVGLNYASHAAESGFELPEQPLIFTKLHASLAGPYDEIPISTDQVDWEVELVVVIGRHARHVRAAEAWEHVAGLTIGQDLSERDIQFRPSNLPQFSLGKSLPRFGPIGPALVTVDEFDDPNDLELVCTVNGEERQRGRTSDFIFSVAELIEYLSALTVLYPGDVIMTGTPSGIGSSRTPPQFLRPGDVVESWIEGIGSMRHAIVRDGLIETTAAAAAGHEGGEH
jgi:2-keto-4-pentenoate hydratase/2-oxohepta-3-ene-1,7-dioic acid hydratase in catechol pathway